MTLFDALKFAQGKRVARKSNPKVSCREIDGHIIQDLHWKDGTFDPFVPGFFHTKSADMLAEDWELVG